jgi:DNA-binding MurR/RpiR family transcriptional regulator
MTEPLTSLLQRLQSVAPSLPRAQQQVIATLLQDPERALSLGVDALARQAKVSMPTIMRTARQFGFEGVREFKLALAQDLARHAPIYSSVTMHDSTPDIVQKILGGAAASIAALQQQLDPLVLEKAANLLAGAQRIDCYSVVWGAKQTRYMMRTSNSSRRRPWVPPVSLWRFHTWGACHSCWKQSVLPDRKAPRSLPSHGPTRHWPKWPMW